MAAAGTSYTFVATINVHHDYRRKLTELGYHPFDNPSIKLLALVEKRKREAEALHPHNLILQKMYRQTYATVTDHYYNNQYKFSYAQNRRRHLTTFSYYLYDHLGRPVETGEVNLFTCMPPAAIECRHFSPAQVTEHMHRWEQRSNVMVAIYHPVKQDRIIAICHYPKLKPATDNNPYPAEQPFTLTLYSYGADGSVNTAYRQCMPGDDLQWLYQIPDTTEQKEEPEETATGKQHNTARQPSQKPKTGEKKNKKEEKPAEEKVKHTKNKPAEKQSRKKDGKAKTIKEPLSNNAGPPPCP